MKKVTTNKKIGADKVRALTPFEAIRSVSVQLDIESRLSHTS